MTLSKTNLVEICRSEMNQLLGNNHGILGIEELSWFRSKTADLLGIVIKNKGNYGYGIFKEKKERYHPMGCHMFYQSREVAEKNLLSQMSLMTSSHLNCQSR